MRTNPKRKRGEMDKIVVKVHVSCDHRVHADNRIQHCLETGFTRSTPWPHQHRVCPDGLTPNLTRVPESAAMIRREHLSLCDFEVENWDAHELSTPEKIYCARPEMSQASGVA